MQPVDWEWVRIAVDPSELEDLFCFTAAGPPTGFVRLSLLCYDVCTGFQLQKRDAPQHETLTERSTG